MHGLRLSLVSGVLALTAACGAPAFVERTTQAVTDPDAADFWARPMPSDLRREADGSWDLDKWPRARESDLLQDWFRTADRRMRGGWGLTAGVFMPITGALDPASLPADPAASTKAGSSVFLMDIDADSPERGRRFPLDVHQLTQLDRYTPEHLLAATPVFGFVRRPATQYALVLTTDVKDAAGEPLGRSLAFHQAFEDAGAADEVVAHFAPLREALEAEGFALEKVAGAAVFTTFEHTQELRDLVAWSESQPAPVLTKPWTAGQEYESYQLFEAAMEMPVIQRGERPYTGQDEGVILRDANGDPTIVEMQEIRLILSVPKAEMPEEGFPLTLYLHGSGGEAYQFANRGPLDEDAPRDQQPEPPPGTGPAEWLARRGVAALGFDFPLHGERHNPPDTSGLVLYNLFGNLSATIDNFNVSAMEVTRISRLVVDTEVPLGSIADVAEGLPDTTVHFDPERLTAFGQSMGTTIGVNWAGVDPRVKGLLFSGAGGMLIEIAVTAIEPVELKGVAELALHLDEDEAEVHIQHPILHAAQNIWDLVDPVAKARYVTAEPYPDRAPRHVMMTAGFRDGYFHPRSQAAIATAMGLPQAGEDAEPILPSVLALAGIDRVSYPVQANLSGRTAAVVQFTAPFNLGHYVVFNQDGARHQYTCFLASVGSGGARLDAPAGLDDPCE
ncbi:MAG: hypothetical protein KC933_16450 [Myxococcales bacterium]|nr:hypothetical protein [Myxococcales bacterium]